MAAPQGARIINGPTESKNRTTFGATIVQKFRYASIIQERSTMFSLFSVPATNPMMAKSETQQIEMKREGSLNQQSKYGGDDMQEYQT